MTTATAIRPADLATLTDDDLAVMCATADDGQLAVIMAVMEKRDEARAYWRAVNARNDAVRNEWREAAYAQYLAAEAACNGELVRRGSPVKDGWQLWSGSERYARAHASEELTNFWLGHPRVTVTAYLAQHAAAGEIYRDDTDRAAMDAADATEGGITDDAMGCDEPASVRRDASGGREDAPVCADGGQHDVSGPDAGRADAGSAADVPGRNAGHVRGGAVATRDSEDGARVDITRGGQPAGYAFRTQVKAGGMLRWAWWGVRADGSMSLRPDKRAAVRAVLA
jgi:hypothetical protein